MLRELIERMAKALVQHPDLVNVSHTCADNAVMLDLTVVQVDLGKVIGKQGQTLEAMRTILAAANCYSEKRVAKTR